MKKKIYFLLISLFFVIILISSSAYFLSLQSPEKAAIIKKLLPNQLKFLIKEEVCLYQYFVPEYKNERIFPQTQFLKLNFHEILLSEIKTRILYFAVQTRKAKKAAPFYIETFDDKNILTAIDGTTFFYETLSFIKNKISNNSKIKNNLPKSITVDDTMIYNNKIFVSFREKNKTCSSREIYVAKINFDFLNFEKFYSHGSIEACKEGSVYAFGGRMAVFDDDGNPSILISTKYPNTENYPLLDQYNKKNEVIMLLINIETRKTRPITAGHRNPQGLVVTKENIILSTEHGPRGGDEINKIIEGKNYGWSTVSYGENYGKQKGITKYEENHSKYGFEEPLYAFVPSIGISQIIKVPQSFSPIWQNNYLLTSLRALSIYRVKFDKNYSRIITIEKIRVGKRIRDIAYNKKYNLFLLALEDGTGSVGVISVN